jgi:disulfide bond formation protein DsbB
MKQRQFILENGLYLSFAVALVATIGSLYLSEVMNFAPCKLCWFQRIFMYPQVFLLGIAAVRKDSRVYRYVLPLSIIGGCISIYHYLIQKVPYFHDHATSCGQVPCEFDYLDWFGFITIPLMALAAFVLIAILQSMLRKAVHDGG